jgi:hypothetical protein
MLRCKALKQCKSITKERRGRRKDQKKTFVLFVSSWLIL